MIFPFRENQRYGTIGRIGLCSVLRPRQHSIGYMGDGRTDRHDATLNATP